MHPFRPLLALADGRRWVFGARDSRGADVVSRLAAIAGLPSAEDGAAALPAARELRISVAAEERGGAFPAGVLPAPEGLALSSCGGAGDHLSCVLRAPADGIDEVLQPLRVLGIPACASVMGGGALLHAALLAHAGRGYLIAGPSGAGKSTAAARVPPPWEALGDELALAVRDRDGRWQAHPWPTWGKIALEGAGRWEVARAVPVAGIFFLEQAPCDESLPLGKGEALCLLSEVAEQATWPLASGMGEARARELRLRQFGNLARLAGDVACRRLRATRHGEFWREILRVADCTEWTACVAG